MIIALCLLRNISKTCIIKPDCLTCCSEGLSIMVGGSSRKVSPLLSCRKQNVMSASSGDVFLTVKVSMWSGYLPSLYL